MLLIFNFSPPFDRSVDPVHTVRSYTSSLFAERSSKADRQRGEGDRKADHRGRVLGCPNHAPQGIADHRRRRRRHGPHRRGADARARRRVRPAPIRCCAPAPRATRRTCAPRRPRSPTPRRAGDDLAAGLHAGRLAPAGGRPPEAVDPLAATAPRPGSSRSTPAASGREPARRRGARRRAPPWPSTPSATRCGRATAASRARSTSGWRACGSSSTATGAAGASARRATLSTPDRRRLAAALDAYAWRLSLAGERVRGE